MIKIKAVKPSQLKTGMVIADEILDQHGRELVRNGTYVDDFIIERLNSLNVNTVMIQYGRPDDNPEDISPEAIRNIQRFRRPDKTKMVISSIIKERVEHNVKNMFINANQPDVAVKMAKTVVSDLMDSIRKNNAIMLSIDDLRISDEYTFKHSVDVAALSMIIARKEKLSEDQIQKIGLAGLLHDLGKTKIPNEILNKPGRLTPEEFEIMKKHSQYSYELVRNNPEVSPDIAIGILQHHEKMNGCGYPFGLTEEHIHPYAKILSVADIFDALATDRPYKKAMNLKDATDLLMTMTAELDSFALRSFLRTILLYPVDSIVQLSNGESARVVSNHPDLPLRPTVVSLKTGAVYNLASTKYLNLVIES
ncbi:MAG: HD-GYP domain-containing protein [Eubacterium sp.]|nr:HD-GYP domain-containing protein [Eubacterium sp.]